MGGGGEGREESTSFTHKINRNLKAHIKTSIVRRKIFFNFIIYFYLFVYFLKQKSGNTDEEVWKAGKNNDLYLEVEKKCLKKIISSTVLLHFLFVTILKKLEVKKGKQNKTNK